MQPYKVVLGLILAFSVLAAQAAAVTANSPKKIAGDDRNITLQTTGTESLEGAATISITYDPTKLHFVSGVAGSLFDPFLVDMGLTDVIAPGDFPNSSSDRNLLIAYLFGFPVADDSAGSLLSLEFEIVSGLPAGLETSVIFNCYEFDVGTCNPGTPPSLDYRFEEVESKVTVLASTTAPIPLPGTLPLVVLGTAAMVWVRRTAKN